MTLNRLTLFLLKDVDQFEDAIDPDKLATREALDEDIEIDGEFWWSARQPSSPPWVDYIAAALPALPDGLVSASASGLLLVRTNDAVFALTFGYGRTFLKPEVIVRGFGLRVALN